MLDSAGATQTQCKKRQYKSTKLVIKEALTHRDFQDYLHMYSFMNLYLLMGSILGVVYKKTIASTQE